LPRAYWVGWVFGLVLMLGDLLRAEPAAPAVILHPGVEVKALSRSELQAIFAMRRRNWPNGTPIQVFVLPDDHPLHQAFCKQILNVYPHQLRRIWDRGVFSGTGQAPIEVKSVEEMQDRVAAVEGAIGYVEGTPLASVKTVTVH
jgi:ABC-type phosphate transport system substrate-binding protein